MQRRLQLTPQRVINTLGSREDGPKRSKVGKLVYIAFYSYEENEGLFSANIVADSCRGFFQPCTYGGKPIESTRSVGFGNWKSILSYTIGGKNTAGPLTIFMEMNFHACVMFQLFPVRPKYSTHCNINIASVMLNSARSSSVLAPVTTEVYYSTLPCVSRCDRIVLHRRTATHSTLTRLLGEHSKIYHGAIDFHFFLISETAPMVARLVISSHMFLADVLKPNRHFYIGSEAAILDLPWTTGFYRLTFERRLLSVHGHLSFCSFPKCFFIQRPISTLDNCSVNFVVSYFRNGIPYHAWHLKKEYRNLVWLSKPETPFTIGIDFEVTENYGGCSGANAPQPVKLYFLYLPRHLLSEGQHVYNAYERDCKVKVDQCRFVKCYHFHQPSLQQQITWDDQKKSCRVFNRTLPRLRDMEESNWLRSLINMNEQNYVPRYISVFLDIYKSQVGSFTLM